MKIVFLFVVFIFLGAPFSVLGDGINEYKPMVLEEDPLGDFVENLEIPTLPPLEEEAEYNCYDSTDKTSVVRGGDIRGFLFPFVSDAPITTGKKTVCSY